MSLVFWLSCCFILAAGILCFIRMVLGPDLADRVVALDLLTTILMSAIALFSIYTHFAMYLDIVLVLALILFLSSSMYARYLHYRSQFQEEGDDFYQ